MGRRHRDGKLHGWGLGSDSMVELNDIGNKIVAALGGSAAGELPGVLSI
jgi:hypothetical protein